MGDTTPVPLRSAIRTWARIGWLGFGGPAGQIALMHRELVERHKWIGEARFMQALNYCMLLPGPEAQQLAVYIGWLMHRTLGGVIAGVLFVLPGMLVLGVLSWLYVRFEQAPLLAAAFFGLKAAVLAIVVEALVRIGRRALKTRFQVLLAGVSFVAIFAFGVPFPMLVLGAAVIGFFVGRGESAKTATVVPEADNVIDRMVDAGDATHHLPDWRRAVRTAVACLALWFAPLAAAALWLGNDHVVTQEGWFFSQAAVVTFGGAYAVLAYVAQHAVEHLQWLRPGEMIDGLALAETTPGPLIMVLQFVGFVAGYRLAGDLDPWVSACLGALMTTWVTFVPSFLFVLVGAPFVESISKSPALRGALSAITAAVVGVILNLSLWFALHTLFRRTTTANIGFARIEVPVPASLDGWALLIAVAALVATLRFKVALGWVLLGSLVAGLLVSGVLT